MDSIAHAVSVPAWLIIVGLVAIVTLFGFIGHGLIARRGVASRNNAGGLCGVIFGVAFMFTCFAFLSLSCAWGVVGSLVCLILYWGSAQMHYGA